MEQSPLAQQSRPNIFKPKVVDHYEILFKTGEPDQPEGFWKELFLLKPDKVQLQRLLSSIPADDLLHRYQESCHELFARAIQQIKTGAEPSDEIALDTLTIFLDGILEKKYTNPSSDIISVLASLDDVDHVFTEFVSVLDNTIRTGRRLELQQSALRTTIAAVSGFYNTALVTYFINRDLFPTLVVFLQNVENPDHGFDAFVLHGVLVNYNKFEFSNPYRMRLEDFVNEPVMSKMLQCVQATLSTCRDLYISAQPEQSPGWKFTGGFQFLGFAAKSRQAATPERGQSMKLTSLPPYTASVLLSLYDFVYANKLFCMSLVTAQQLDQHTESPLASFLSFVSHILQNAHYSSRSSLYANLSLLTIRILVEDQSIVSQLCDSERKMSAQLCRQRQPTLPLVKDNRVPALVVIDVITDGINHNLKKRLDVDLYQSLSGILIRLLTALSKARIRVAHHWSEVWRCLISLVQFLNNYSEALLPLPNIYSVADNLIVLLSLAVATGETFLPDATSYDDLFYKIFEAGDSFHKIRDNFSMSERPTAKASIEMLTSVVVHYKALLESQKSKGKKHLSPQDVNKLIREGYESLDISATEGLGSWVKYREAEKKTMIKTVTRLAVQDLRPDT